MNTKRNHLIAFLLLSFSVFSACSDDEGSPQPATVNFANTEANISNTASAAVIKISFSRAASNAGSIVLSIDDDELAYGPEADYYVEPEAEDNKIILDYVAGAEGVQFTLHAGEGLNIQEDREVVITLSDTNGRLNIGQNTSVRILFSENFVASSGTITLDAGGEAFGLQAFVDLSKLTSTSIDKYTWDLGFYSGEGHHVIVNNAAYIMARPLDKTDLNSVTAADTTGFGGVVSVPNFDPTSGASSWIDDHSGDLAKTAFGTISGTASENKVFIIKRDGDGRNWKKVRVLQHGDGYTLEYADIDATTFSSVDIAKDDAANFTFFDLDNGLTTVEPEKDSWDISYGTYAIRYAFSGAAIPYGFKDFITINRHNTSAALVLTENIAYEDFGAGDIASLDWNTAVDAIGDDWRSTQPLELYTDRFFVLKDAQDNYYKIKFTAMSNSSGERGYASFNFEKL